MKNAFWVIGILAIGLLLIVAPKDFESNKRKFHSEAWKISGYRMRGTMCHDLRVQKTLLAKTRSEVKNILGEPQEEYAEFIKYAIDLGGIWERWMIRYTFMIEFDTETGLVTSAHLMDN